MILWHVKSQTMTFEHKSRGLICGHDKVKKQKRGLGLTHTVIKKSPRGANNKKHLKHVGRDMQASIYTTSHIKWICYTEFYC